MRAVTCNVRWKVRELNIAAMGPALTSYSEVDRAPRSHSTSTLTFSGSYPTMLSRIRSIVMGKHKKKPQNIVKLDLEEHTLGKEEILPICVQHSSKDSHHIEQTIHAVPAPRDNPPPPTFNPSLAFKATQDSMSAKGPGPADELNGLEHVCLCPLSS